MSANRKDDSQAQPIRRRPTTYVYRMDEAQAEPSVEPIADLTGQGESVSDAGQVKGGFNPQPEPPKTRPPVFFIPPFRGVIGLG